jgi:hypothetical protein
MGIKTFQHQVRYGQTTQSIKEYYRLSDEEWDFFNLQYKGRAVAVGELISVPIPNRAIIRYEQSSTYNRRTCIPIIHIVKRGETFFSIYKRFYDIDEKILMQRNNLKSTNLKIGQRLHVGWFNTNGVPPAKEGATPISPEMQEMIPYRDLYFQRLASRDEFEHSGMAVQSDVGALRYGYKVYHDYAKVGSCIRLTNPARNATVYAEVVGRIPSSIKQQYFGREILAVYTPKIRRVLGIVDQQFYAVIRFTK